jgi:hypothetical protein
MMWQTEQDPKQVIQNKILEIELGQNYKPSVTQVVKKFYDVVMFENHANNRNIDLHSCLRIMQIIEILIFTHA